jgi:plasmid stability protein
VKYSVGFRSRVRNADLHCNLEEEIVQELRVLAQKHKRCMQARGI